MSDYRIVIKDTGLAGELNRITAEYQSQLTSLLDRARDVEQSEDIKLLALGVGDVLATLGRDILFPIYRSHPKLIPEELKSCMDNEAQHANPT